MGIAADIVIIILAATLLGLVAHRLGIPLLIAANTWQAADFGAYTLTAQISAAPRILATTQDSPSKFPLE